MDHLCQGDCERHVGPVQLVHVWTDAYDWGEFWYCSAAITEDRHRGFHIEIVERDNALSAKEKEG